MFGKKTAGWACYICPARFPSAWKLRKHMKQCHGR